MEDMQIKEKHDRLLYYTGYNGSSKVSRIQFDLGFTLSIIFRRVMHHAGIPTHRFSTRHIAIYGFNSNGTHQMGKIQLRCQIRNLKCKVTCYVLDVDSLATSC